MNEMEFRNMAATTPLSLQGIKLQKCFLLCLFYLIFINNDSYQFTSKKFISILYVIINIPFFFLCEPKGDCNFQSGGGGIY